MTLFSSIFNICHVFPQIIRMSEAHNVWLLAHLELLVLRRLSKSLQDNNPFVFQFLCACTHQFRLYAFGLELLGFDMTLSLPFNICHMRPTLTGYCGLSPSFLCVHSTVISKMCTMWAQLTKNAIKKLQQ